MANQQLIDLSQDLSNWLPMRTIAEQNPQFSYQTLKALFWKRAERPGLDRCSRLVGKRLLINAPLFGLWLAGQLPEQQTDD